jgi:hypothetical protein
MSESVQFEYELPGGDIIEISATVVPGRPTIQASLYFPGEPEDDPEIEITDCFLTDRENTPTATDIPIDLEGLYYRVDRGKFELILDDIEKRAWDAYRDNL